MDVCVCVCGCVLCSLFVSTWLVEVMWPRCELDSTCRPTSRVESFARGTDEENDQEPYIMHSYDLFVFCGSDAVIYG